jgi:hypothetical protein
MVHGGPRTEDRPELAGVLTGWSYAAQMLVMATAKRRGEHWAPHLGLHRTARRRGEASGGEGWTMAVELSVV